MTTSKVPKPIDDLIKYFDRMPGIGPKSAARLAFYWLRVPKHEAQGFANALVVLKDQIKRCRNCYNLSLEEECEICRSEDREKKLVCVVEDALDLITIERAGNFNGVFHVLEGAISPLNRVDPEDLTIGALIERVKRLAKNTESGDKSAKASRDDMVEVLIATNPTMEGEATAMYIRDQLKQIPNVKVTRLAQGLPNGADIEYADSLTISRALEQRSAYK